MQLSIQQFNHFIDEKYTPLRWQLKLGIALALPLLASLLFLFLSYLPNSDEISRLEQEQQQAKQAVMVAKRKAAKLPAFEKEINETQIIFENLAALLPKEKEIPKLLKDISALGSHAGLEFLSFKPQSDRPRDFYTEIPISIQVKGPYHNVGYFFDEITKLERIVSVKSVTMGSPKKEEGEVLLASNCQLVTYRFTNTKLPKKKKK